MVSVVVRGQKGKRVIVSDLFRECSREDTGQKEEKLALATVR